MEMGLIILSDYCLTLVSQSVTRHYPLSMTQANTNTNTTYFAQDAEDHCLLHFGNTHRDFLAPIKHKSDLPKQLDQLSQLMAFAWDDFFNICHQNNTQCPTHIAAAIPSHIIGTELSLVATALSQLPLPLAGIFHTACLAAAPLNVGRYLVLSLHQHTIRVASVEKATDNTLHVVQERPPLAYGFASILAKILERANQQFMAQHKINLKKSVEFEQAIHSAITRFWFRHPTPSEPLTLTIKTATIEFAPHEIQAMLSDIHAHIEALSLSEYDGIIADDALTIVCPINHMAPHRALLATDCLTNLIASQTFQALSPSLHKGQAPRLIRTIQSDATPTYRLATPTLNNTASHLLVNHHLYNLTPFRHNSKRIGYVLADFPHITDQAKSTSPPLATFQLTAQGIEVSPTDSDEKANQLPIILTGNSSNMLDIEGLKIQALTEIQTAS